MYAQSDYTVTRSLGVTAKNLEMVTNHVCSNRGFKNVVVGIFRFSVFMNKALVPEVQEFAEISVVDGVVSFAPKKHNIEK